ncbi:MAG: Hfq-like protein [Blastocatellia bacterium]
MNRKLIRTTLAEVKEREMHAQQTRRAPEPPPPPPAHSNQSGHSHSAGHSGHSAGHSSHAAPAPQPSQSGQGQAGQSGQPKKKIPPEQTNAESFYYKKQMDAHTPMVLVLQDNEKLAGTIEWYDKNSIKLHRQEGPNLLVLKHNIKYLYKDQSDDEE